METNLDKVKEILTKMGKMQVNLQSQSAIDIYAKMIVESLNKDKKNIVLHEVFEVLQGPSRKPNNGK